MYVSLVIPIYNERQNVLVLYRELDTLLRDQPMACEILFVDDGSTDGTIDHLRSLQAKDDRVRVVELRRNYGQTAAMQAGFDLAKGDVIVTLDGDLQNDPADIPMMLGKLEEGYDLVHGWRKRRKDNWLTRRVPSWIANRLISRLTGVDVHDLGCTLKAIRGEIARELELCGEMHRFIPILAHQRGARCAEVVTNHRPRRYGVSKYGLSRTLRVILDLMTVKFMLDYLASPMHLFGKLGIGSGLCGVGMWLTAGIMKLTTGMPFMSSPLLILGGLFALVGLHMLSLCILSEFAVRIYFDRERRLPYAIGRQYGFDRPVAYQAA
ncbi:MAG: glycosyltransferase family 2 protein [Planctomycetota bacterium]